MRSVIFACLLATLILAQPVMGRNLIDFDINPLCYNDGHMEFTFGGGGGSKTSLDPSRINITARHEDSDEWFDVPGSFYEHYYHIHLETEVWEIIDTEYPNVMTYVNSQESMFSSDEGVFNQAGHYLLNITYPDTIRYTDGFFDCMGLLFTCALVNVTADRCFTKNGTFYAYFMANGVYGQSADPDARKINMTKEAVYRLTGPGFSFHGFSSATNLEHMGDGKHLFTYSTQENITEFEIEISPCIHKHFSLSRSKISCGEPPECISDRECDDNDPCTEDSCAGEKCSYKDICEEEPAVMDIHDVAEPSEPAPSYDVPQEAAAAEPEEEPPRVEGGGMKSWLDSILGQLLSVLGLR